MTCSAKTSPYTPMVHVLKQTLNEWAIMCTIYPIAAASTKCTSNVHNRT